MGALLPAPVEIKPLASLGSTLERARRDATKNAAQDFESVFITQMLQPMFEGIKTDGMFGGGSSEGVFRSLMIQEVGKEISRSGGIGISEPIYDHMLKMQGLGGTPAKDGMPLSAPVAANLSDAVLGQMLKMQGAASPGEEP